MPSDWLRGSRFAYLLVACVLCLAVMSVGCDDRVTDDDEVLDAARRRVVENVLPDISQESEDVLRNLTNLLSALPQICATPMATLGSFTSDLPALGTPRSVVFVGDDEEDEDEDIFFGSWILKWPDVLLGGDGASTTEDTPRVDITLNVRQRSSQQSTLQVVPFTLLPESALLATATGGQPSLLEDRAAFYLFQDEATGVWTLRWQTPETAKVFEGTITAPAFSRVIRRVSDLPGDVVESLEVEATSNLLTFEEMTVPGAKKGFTFFVRPGELIRVELKIGDTEDDLVPITRDQLRIGGGSDQLPTSEDPDDFELATNLPMVMTTGAPTFSAGTDLGTFIWQDVEQNTCNAGEDQWRVRFSTDGVQREFDGDITALDDDESAELTFTTVGPCQGDLTDGGQTLDYTCTLAGDRVGGYDICVTGGRRVRFISAVNDVPDPGLIFVGAERQPPSSPDSFSIVFDIDLEERQSASDLILEDAQIVLRGNSSLDGVLRINPDQLSLDPLCGRLPAEIESIVRPQVASTFQPAEPLVQPRVRFSGGGDYSSSRFDGSSYELEEVEFLDPAVDTLDDVRLFPDRGQIELRTRLEDEVENTFVTGEVEEIEEDETGRVTLPVEYELNISRVIFEVGFNEDECKQLQEVLGFNPCVVNLTIVE